jgi:hypothetical protein
MILHLAHPAESRDRLEPAFERRIDGGDQQIQPRQFPPGCFGAIHWYGSFLL